MSFILRMDLKSLKQSKLFDICLTVQTELFHFQNQALSYFDTYFIPDLKDTFCLEHEIQLNGLKMSVVSELYFGIGILKL